VQPRAPAVVQHDQSVGIASLLRERGLFEPRKELMAPYQSSDYLDIASGAWRQAEGWGSPRPLAAVSRG